VAKVAIEFVISRRENLSTFLECAVSRLEIGAGDVGLA
jgi:hypothetical protein